MRSHAMVLRPGAVLAGKYALRREIGRGAVGLVFEAEHLRLRQRYAVKALNGNLRGEPELVERFEREARAMASLKSPYVTSIFDVDVTADGTPYMVMELLEGKDLQRELRERSQMPAGEIVRMVMQACEGIAVVHAAGIVHRDLKPSNLFLAQQGASRIVKVMDFGISKVAGDETTQTGSGLGTPAYMSPEQVKCARDVDARTDVWALGVILYRALAGHLPFEAEGITGMGSAIVSEPHKPLLETRPDLPVALVRVIDTMLAKERDARFASVLDVREALVPFAEEIPIATSNAPPALTTTQPSLRSATSATPASSDRISFSSASAPPGVTTTLAKARSTRTSRIVAAAIALVCISAAIVPWLLRRPAREEAAAPIPPAIAATPALAPPSATPSSAVTDPAVTSPPNDDLDFDVEQAGAPAASSAPKAERKPPRPPPPPPKRNGLPTLL